MLGLGVIVAMIITRGAVERVVAAAPNLAERPGGRAAIQSIVGGASSSLMRLSALLILLAIVVVLVAMAVRRWRFADVLLTVAVVVGALVVGLLGLSIWSLLAGIVLAVAVALVTPRVLHRPASTVEVEASTLRE
jgi:hypothetical protein